MWQRVACHAAAMGIDKTKLVINYLEKEVDEYGVSEANITVARACSKKLPKYPQLIQDYLGGALEKILLSSAFCEALLQKLNLQQATGKLAKIVNQGHSQVVA